MIKNFTGFKGVNGFIIRSIKPLKNSNGKRRGAQKLFWKKTATFNFKRNYPSEKEHRKLLLTLSDTREVKRRIVVTKRCAILTLHKWNTHTITNRVPFPSRSQTLVTKSGAIFDLSVSNKTHRTQMVTSIIADPYRWLFAGVQWAVVGSFSSAHSRAISVSHKKKPIILAFLGSGRSRYRNTFEWLKFNFVVKQTHKMMYVKNRAVLPRHYPVKKADRAFYLRLHKSKEAYGQAGRLDADSEIVKQGSYFVDLLQPKLKIKTVNLRQERRRRWPKWKAKRWRKKYGDKPAVSWEEKQFANKKKQMNNEANTRVQLNRYRKNRWIISKRVSRRKRKYVFLRLRTRLETGQDFNPFVRKRIWPSVVLPDYIFPHISRAAIKLDKRRRISTVTKTFFRSRAKLVKFASAERSTIQKINNFAHKLKKLLPYHSLDYVLKFRKWHTPRDKRGSPVGRPELTDSELLTRSAQQEFRYQKKQGLYREAWAEKDPKKKSELLTRAASKDLMPPKYFDPVWNELKKETGYPATLGYRYERSVFRNTFLTNRWWQPLATPTPARHPFSLVKTDDQPVFFKTSYDYNRYYSSVDFYRKDLLSHRTSNLNCNVSSLSLKKSQAFRLRQAAKQNKKRNDVSKQQFELKTVLNLRHELNTDEFKDKVATSWERFLSIYIKKEELISVNSVSKEKGTVNLTSKERGSVYQLWVKRQRIKNKTSNLLLSSCDQAEGKTRTVYRLPFARPRFPARADSGISYAGSLSRYYRKVRRPRFKFISNFNFKLLRAPLFKQKKALQEWSESTPAHELMRKRGITLAKNVYISKNWRTVNKKRGSNQAFRAARYSDDIRQGQTFTGIKRRFTRSPLKIKKDEQKQIAWMLSPTITGTNKSYRLAVLQTGLAKRAETSEVLDDRKEIRLRSPAVDQVLPSWRERANIKEAYQWFVSTKAPKKHTRYARALTGIWCWNPAAVTATSTSKQPYKKTGVSSFGENLLLPARFERESWIKNVYSIWTLNRQNYIKIISDPQQSNHISSPKVAFRSKAKDHLGRRIRTTGSRDYDKRREPFNKKNKSIYRFFVKNRDTRRENRRFTVKVVVPTSSPRKKVHSAFTWNSSWDLSSIVYNARQTKISKKWKRTKFIGQSRPKKPKFKCTVWWHTKSDSIKTKSKKYKIHKTAYRLNLKKWRKNRYENGKNIQSIIQNRPKSSMQLFNQQSRTWIAKVNGIKVLPVRQKDAKVHTAVVKSKRSKQSTVCARLQAHTLRELLPVHRSFLSKRRHDRVSKEKILRKIEDAKIAAYEKYRYTTEIVETTTSFFPALMSWLRKKHFSTDVKSHPETERLIYNVYWSIRFYLGQDFFNARLYMQDNTKRFRVARAEEVYENSERRYFTDEHSEVMQARRQPFSITRKKPQWKGGLWFLRYWFPRLYKCHLEDALRFDLLTFSPSDARRVQPGADSVTKWKTLEHGDTDDYAFERRIHGTPKQKRTRRYETVLKTARRQKPVLAGLVPNKNFEGLYSEQEDLDFCVQTNFFKKSYSTDFNIHDVKARLTLTLELLTVQRRHVSVTERQAPTQFVAKAYSQRKKLTITHGRRHRALDRENHSDGALNNLFIRGKSPRNAQYLQRQGKRANTLTTTFRARKLLNLRNSRFLKPTNASSAGGREPRHYLSSRGLLLSKFDCLSQQRQIISKRRLPSALRAIRQTIMWSAPTKFRPRPKKEVRRKAEKIGSDKLKAKRVCTYVNSIKWTTNDYNPFVEIAGVGSRMIVAGKPSLLQLRTAKQRTTFLRWSHKPLYVVNTRIVRKSSVVKNFLHPRCAERILIIAQKKFIMYGLFTAEVAVVYPKTRPYHVILLEIKYAEKRRLAERRETLTNLPNQLMLGTNDVSLLENNNVLMVLPAKKEISRNAVRLPSKNGLINREKKHKLWKNFAVFRGTLRGVLKVQNAVYKTKTELKSRNRINERRGEFWQLLASKFWLKLRFFKNWIKERKRYLIRSDWSEIPEVIFKERRTRVRLFEWVESDEHFYREGWKNAFRLYPSERALAPWLQPLRLLRTAANTAHGEYRRYAFPREQKRWKARQYYRKSRATLDPKHFYVKGRRWPRVRTTAYRRARSLFEFRNTHSAQTHFKKISKYTTKTTGFSRNAFGLYNRLDVNLILLKFFTTVFWARRFAGYGIVKVNTIKATKANHRFLPGDKLEFAWEKIKRAQAIFLAYVSYSRNEDYYRNIILQELPGNYAWHSGFRLLTYKNLPTPEDVPDNARLCRWLFDSFRRDAGIGRR